MIHSLSPALGKIPGFEEGAVVPKPQYRIHDYATRWEGFKAWLDAEMIPLP